MSKPNFSFEVREAVDYAQAGWCKHCDKGIDDFHHRIHNTKANRKLFPLLIQSVFNCVGLCRECHTSESWRYSISLNEAVMYEQALTLLKQEDPCGIQKQR